MERGFSHETRKRHLVLPGQWLRHIPRCAAGGVAEGGTVMTAEEIVRDYQQAKNKQKQIKILADLNCTSPSAIKAILAEAGVEGVAAPKRMVHRSAPKQASVYDRIEAILNYLPADASARVRGTALDMVTAMFQEYVLERFKNRNPSQHETQK